MRFLMKCVIVLAVLWCAWWALASWGAAQALNAWVENRRAAGWQVTAETAQAGFPLNIRTNVTALSVFDPAAQSTLRLNGGAVKARTYWPGYVDMDLPDTPIIWEVPGGQIALQANNASAALRIKPGFALQLDSLRVFSDAWRVTAYDQDLLISDDLTLIAQQDAEIAEQYALTLAMTSLAPGAQIRQLLSLPAGWPQTFETFTATGSATFDTPLSPAAFEDSPPQLRGLTITQADIIWGALALNASGTLRIDATGIPTGEMTLQARNWRALLDLAELTGTLPRDRRMQAELMFALMANRSGRPEDIDLPVTFQNGQMSVSGIPLGPAPRLIWQ